MTTNIVITTRVLENLGATGTDEANLLAKAAVFDDDEVVVLSVVYAAEIAVSEAKALGSAVVALPNLRNGSKVPRFGVVTVVASSFLA